MARTHGSPRAGPARCPPGGNLASVVEVAEHSAEIAGLATSWRSAGEAATPTLYVHGVPNSASLWQPFLAAHGGVAPDLPGFGTSAKPGHFPYAIDGYADWLEVFAEHVGLERFNLVVHDWGAVGLALAQRHPERVERIVVIDAVPFLPGYRWHRIARAWRTPVLGELVMGATTRTALRVLSREATPRAGPLPAAALDEIWRHFDHGTQRAILRLYRSAPPHVLERAGAGLEALGGPALVAWGVHDPYIHPDFADAYAARLRGATVEHVADAGHWPWIDRPELVDRVGAFLRDP